jgi:hypothetical protein
LPTWLKPTRGCRNGRARMTTSLGPPTRIAPSGSPAVALIGTSASLCVFPATGPPPRYVGGFLQYNITGMGALQPTSSGRRRRLRWPPATPARGDSG